MSNTAIASISTHEVPTTIQREEHPVSVITPTQQKVIEKTWKVVEGDLMSAGLLLFRRIFEIAPGALQLFPKFVDLQVQEREENEVYRAHALQVTEAIGLAVSAMDDLPSLYMVLNDLGSVHTAHGIQDAHFDVVGEALLWTLGHGLGEEFTPEVKEAWTCFYDLVATHMKQGLNEAYAAQNGE